MAGRPLERPAPRTANWTTPRPAPADREFSGGPDTWLVGSAAILVALGLIMVFSASSATAYAMHHDALYYLKRQAAFLIVGCVAATIAYRWNYQGLRRAAPIAIWLSVTALCLVLVPHLGIRANGAQRWFSLGFLSIQPSEFAKLGLVVYLAAALDQKGDKIRSLGGGLFPLVAVVCACVLLVFFEPDIGTASLFAFTAGAMLFAAGARIGHLIAIPAVTVPFIVFDVAHHHGYEMERLLAFHDPWKYQQSYGFLIVQSLLALGSGGVFGRGLGLSVSKYFYLPESHT
ncbi:MAG: FtsW/RodA/SpoVE family cell cycle protein, partial [Vulcanimicrobiaceae bacterium]